MTSVVVEGIDNSGKSSLITKINAKLSLPLQPGEGPPRPGEHINDRITKYRDAHQGDVWLYDRHPVVSQPIYGKINPTVQLVAGHLTSEFYASKPVLVYCDPLDRGLGQHVKRTGAGNEHIDTPEFLEGLTKRYDIMLSEYRLWAVRHADLVYRIGDDASELAKAIHLLVEYRTLNTWLTRSANS